MPRGGVGPSSEAATFVSDLPAANGCRTLSGTAALRSSLGIRRLDTRALILRACPKVVAIRRILDTRPTVLRTRGQSTVCGAYFRTRAGNRGARVHSTALSAAERRTGAQSHVVRVHSTVRCDAD